MSRRLRFRTNVIYAWESGRRAPTAAQFFVLCERVGIDVRAAITRFVGALPPRLARASFSEPRTVAAFLSELGEGTTLVELSRRVGKNRVSVGRWLKGEAEPRLPEFLRLIEAASLRLLDFIDAFVSPASLPEAVEAWRVLEAQRRVAYELPWSHAVLRVLELSAYRQLQQHDDAFVAARLGIGVEEAARCIAALAASKLIVRRRGRWSAQEVLTVDTRRNPAAGRQLKRHWAEVAFERLFALEPRGQDLFSYNLFTVSERDWERLRELHIAYYQELRRIIDASEPAERVALVNLQLLRLDEPCDATPSST